MSDVKVFYTLREYRLGEDSGIELSYRESDLSRYVFQKPLCFRFFDAIPFRNIEDRIWILNYSLDPEIWQEIASNYIPIESHGLFFDWIKLFERWVDVQVLGQVPESITQLIQITELTGFRLGFTFTKEAL